MSSDAQNTYIQARGFSVVVGCARRISTSKKFLMLCDAINCYVDWGQPVTPKSIVKHSNFVRDCMQKFHPKYFVPLCIFTMLAVAHVHREGVHKTAAAV